MKQKTRTQDLWIYRKTAQGTAGTLLTVLRGTREECLKTAQEQYADKLWSWQYR